MVPAGKCQEEDKDSPARNHRETIMSLGNQEAVDDHGLVTAGLLFLFAGSVLVERPVINREQTAVHLKTEKKQTR